MQFVFPAIWTKEILWEMHEILVIILESTERLLKSGRDSTLYDIKDNSLGFQPGDLIWLHNPQKRMAGRCSTLSPNWEGPLLSWWGPMLSFTGFDRDWRRKWRLFTWLMFQFETIRTKKRALLRKITQTSHRYDTYELVCTAMMDDTSSVTGAGRRSPKKSLEAEVAMDAL